MLARDFLRTRFPDLPHLLALTLDQPRFFYLYKTPAAGGGEHTETRLV